MPDKTPLGQALKDAASSGDTPAPVASIAARAHRRRTAQRIVATAAVLAIVGAASTAVLRRTSANDVSTIDTGKPVGTATQPATTGAVPPTTATSTTVVPVETRPIDLDFPLGQSATAHIPVDYDITEIHFLLPTTRHFQLNVELVNAPAAKLAAERCPAGLDCLPRPMSPDGTYIRWVFGDPTQPPAPGSGPSFATVSYGVWTLAIDGPDFEAADVIARSLRGTPTEHGVRLTSTSPDLPLDVSMERAVLRRSLGTEQWTTFSVVPNCNPGDPEDPPWTCGTGAASSDPAVAVDLH